ncbi:TPA: PfkB family carbohydrate kinase [Klebsiella pneumoniae]|jgi:ribokinase
MKKMTKIEYLRKKLVDEKELNIKRESMFLSVSERTIRRYIEELFSMGIATKFHGGARLKDINPNSMVSKSIDEMRSITLNHKNVVASSININNSHYLYIFGSFNLDVVTEVFRFPNVGETIKAKATNFFPGGKGANQAVAAAQLVDNVHFFVKVGKDSFGDNAEKYFSSSRIKSIKLIRDEKYNTGNALVMVENAAGNNSIVIDLGSNSKITKEEIVSDFVNLKKSSIFLTQLENNIDATKFAIENAKAANCYVILNPAPYSEKINSHLQYIDLLTPNETEAELITGIKITNIKSAEDAIKKIYEMGVKEIVITLGSKGSLYFNGDVMKRYKAMRASVVDTSGAGDAFTGSLAACLMEGTHIDQAIKFSTAFSSLAVEKHGASSMPTRAMVEERFKNGSHLD